MCPRGLLQDISTECRPWGSSTTGSKPQPELRQEMGAQGWDLDGISFSRRRMWSWSRLSRPRTDRGQCRLKFLIRRIGSKTRESTPRPHSAPAKRNIVQIRVLSTHFQANCRSRPDRAYSRAKFHLIELRAGHGHGHPKESYPQTRSRPFPGEVPSGQTSRRPWAIPSIGILRRATPQTQPRSIRGRPGFGFGPMRGRWGRSVGCSFSSRARRPRARPHALF